MKRTLLVLVALVASGCATPRVAAKHEDKITLEFKTGRIGEKLYTKRFEEKASSVCPTGYEVLEKTHTPSTIPESLSKAHFYWVIRCKG